MSTPGQERIDRLVHQVTPPVAAGLVADLLHGEPREYRFLEVDGPRVGGAW
jgi:hypothetical protein